MGDFFSNLNDFFSNLLDNLTSGGSDFLSQVSDALGDFIADHGIVAAFGLIFVEESGIPMPVPGDVMVMYVGRQVSLGEISWWVAWLTFIVVVTCGALVLFSIARFFGDGLQRRIGGLMHLNEKNLKRAEAWFERRGPLAIIFGRHIPGLRIPITVAAGIFKVRYPVFAVSVAISTAIWSGVFLTVGYLFGERALRLLHPGRGVYLFLALAVLGLFITSMVLRRRRHRRETLVSVG